MATQGQQQWPAPSAREKRLLDLIEDLQRQVEDLRSIQRPPPQRRQVLPEPERFTGRMRDWDTWVLTMKAKLQVDGIAIGDESAQFYYVYSSLSASVQGLVMAYVRRAEEKGEWKPYALLEQLQRSYDDPNKAKKAGQRLRELQQGSTSAATYIPRFERTLFEAGADTWPDDAKITTLVGGLNKETKQRLNGQLELPSGYDAFVRTVLSLNGQFGQPAPQTMDWEPTRAAAARPAPTVSPSQRQKWREDGKCVRCGSAKHWVSKCPHQASRSRSPSPTSIHGAQARATPMITTVARTRTKTTARRTGPPVYSDEDSDGDFYLYND